MVDYSEKLSRVNNPELKEEPIYEEIFIKNEPIIKEEVDIKWNEINDDNERISESSKFQNVEDSKPISMSLEGTILEDLQQNSYQNQFSNIDQENLLNSSERIVCPNCNGLLMSRENLETHLQFCKPVFKYLCNKCPFVTSEESLLTHHTETTHVPKKCPKCEILCENQASFLLHYQSCQSKDDIYFCEKCTYQCRDISMLNFHIKLMHSSGQIVINIDKSNLPQKKCVNLTLLLSEIPEKAVLPIKSSNIKENNDLIEQDDIGNPLLPQQKNSFEKDYFKKDDKMIAKTDPPHNSNKTSNASIAKVCRVCDIIITTKVTVTDKCKICKKLSMLWCNQCNRYFENYQKVSLHLWTECLCLECDFRSPYKYGVRCDKYHPNPVMADHAEYKVIESNTQGPDYAKRDEQKANANSSMPIKGSLNISRLTQIKKFIKFIIWYCPTCHKDTKLKTSIINRYIQSCKDCKTNMWCKCAKCKKIYKKCHEYLLNHLRTVCYQEELLEY